MDDASRVALELAHCLRDFSTASDRNPVVVVAPFALHDAQLADLAPGHSLLEALLLTDALITVDGNPRRRRQGCIRSIRNSRPSMSPSTTWTPSTSSAFVKAAIVARHAARVFLRKCVVVLVGAPIDIKAGRRVDDAISSLSDVVIDELIATEAFFLDET
jgi:hypothetical protein